MANPKVYYRPQTLVEAIEYVARPGGVALAGGALAFGVQTLPYEIVVDLQDIAEIQKIEVIDSVLRIGGAVTLTQVIEYPLVPLALKSSLIRAIPPNLRNNTSVGETLMVSGSSNLLLREWLAMLRIMDTRVEYAGQESSVPLSVWEQSLQDFVQFAHERGGRFQGLIAYLLVPLPQGQSVLGTAFVSRTPADAPIVNAAAMVTLANDGTVMNAGAAVCGASAQSVMLLDLKLLDGKPLTEASIAYAAKNVPVQVNPVGDYLGSVDYRRAMARECVRRALLECMAQLQSG